LKHEILASKFRK